MNIANKQRIKARIAKAEKARSDAWNFADLQFPREDWYYEVQNGDTLLGYIDWVIGKLESLGA
jgi:hypothetical protein